MIYFQVLLYDLHEVIRYNHENSLSQVCKDTSIIRR